ncbi:SCO family protein [Methylovirgula sp. HY1]|uniref:SCO family protein n=1 Tax=Methylovirgula sp. HY1 TaxID=2822761 RepID=UPI001C5B9ECF|nr:SCO family protein [Methylovirgula sp. HY1]QXX75347.1 SCO1 protein [Methylovirgula sp. HY1]
MIAASRRLPLLIAVLALALLGLGVVTVVTRPSPQQAQPSSIGGPFTLTDDNGRSVTDADFKGHPFLVFFGYTHCPDVCPTTLYDLSQVLKAMGADTKVKVLFITVDPARDTTQQMKEYLTSFDPHIVGLSGNARETKAVERAYRVYAKKVPGKNGDYTMDHTSIIYLMNKDGRFVSTFDLDRKPKVAAAELRKYL